MEEHWYLSKERENVRACVFMCEWICVCVFLYVYIGIEEKRAKDWAHLPNIGKILGTEVNQESVVSYDVPESSKRILTLGRMEGSPQVSLTKFCKVK